MTLVECFAELAARGSLACADWPADEDPAAFGLAVAADRIVPVIAHDPLSEPRIRAALSPRASGWLRRLDVHPVIGSTNLELMARARTESVQGAVCTAELQMQGRGRRGRAWASPFGASVAVSIGLAVDLPPAELGGVSLVVGLAALEALELRGATGLGLKWPNDLLLDDAKLGGILIEVAQGRGTELVAGIGMNVVLPDSVRNGLPANVTDLTAAGVHTPRSDLVGALVSSVVEFVGEFQRVGFEPFRLAFDSRHYYHGRECDVVQDGRRITGTVIGVTPRGELRLRTAAGDRTFHGGDVSLRQHT